MSTPLVPVGFTVPTSLVRPGFRLEPLGPEHNERDHEAWMTSIDHIRATPGMDAWAGSWPEPMSLEENRADLVGHAAEFVARTRFAYSILDGDRVVGCLYIDPSPDPTHDAHVLSWVRADRADLDGVVWREVSDWLRTIWPFASVRYESRG